MPKQEFLYVDDMNPACVNIMNLGKTTYSQNTEFILSHINAGGDQDLPSGNLLKRLVRLSAIWEK